MRAVPIWTRDRKADEALRLLSKGNLHVRRVIF